VPLGNEWETIMASRGNTWPHMASVQQERYCSQAWWPTIMQAAKIPLDQLSCSAGTPKGEGLEGTDLGFP